MKFYQVIAHQSPMFKRPLLTTPDYHEAEEVAMRAMRDGWEVVEVRELPQEHHEDKVADLLHLGIIVTVFVIGVIVGRLA